jgi:hypothetical protein
MYKLCNTVLIVSLICATTAFAQAPCGFRGNVYDHTSNPAGSQFYDLHIERLDAAGTAGYNYEPYNSKWSVYCGTGLVAGDWAIYAITYERGTYYYSNWKVYYDWDPHESTAPHNFYCISKSPPPPLE